MRFAGDMFKEPMSESRRSYEGLQDKPIVPGFNTEDLEVTPELQMDGYQGPGADLFKDRYIQTQPGSGISMLPGGEQGPSQGPNTPIKNYGGKYMPDGSQPTGYRHGPMAGVPAGLLRSGFV